MNVFGWLKKEVLETLGVPMIKKGIEKTKEFVNAPKNEFRQVLLYMGLFSLVLVWYMKK